MATGELSPAGSASSDENILPQISNSDEGSSGINANVPRVNNREVAQVVTAAIAEITKRTVDKLGVTVEQLGFNGLSDLAGLITTFYFCKGDLSLTDKTVMEWVHQMSPKVERMVGFIWTLREEVASLFSTNTELPPHSFDQVFRTMRVKYIDQVAWDPDQDAIRIPSQQEMMEYL